MSYLKTFEQALTDMARHVTADLGPTVDLVEGSVTLSLLEGVAFQTADLSERQERSILEAIPTSVYEAFNFPAQPARPAQGTLVFHTPVPARDVILIPSGSEAIGDNDQVYATIQDGWVLPGDTQASVPAVAVDPGENSNAGALSVVRLATGIPGIQGVTNPAPFSGGTNIESPDAHRARFVEYLASLDGSAKAGLRAAVLAATVAGPTPGSEITATDALVLDRDDDPLIPPAYMQVYAYRRGGIPAALDEQIRAAVEAARATGSVPLIAWTAGTPVPVTILVDCPDQTQATQAQAAVAQAVAEYFAALRYGQKASIENLITSATKAHPAIAEIRMVTPTSDVPCSTREHLELGALSVTGGQ